MNRVDRKPGVRLVTDPPAVFRMEDGSLHRARNGSEVVSLWGLARLKSGQPPLTPEEIDAVWRWRSTGVWEVTPVGV